ncbi:MAG: hypothetical protein H7Y43_11090 [Akkermansiaceae bacterium]|nr:hypothetical protein [Verrucomicrobiales bacterium]
MKKLTPILIAVLALAFVGCATRHASNDSTASCCVAASPSGETVVWTALPPEVTP